MIPDLISLGVAETFQTGARRLWKAVGEFILGFPSLQISFLRLVFLFPRSLRDARNQTTWRSLTCESVTIFPAFYVHGLFLLTG